MLQEPAEETHQAPPPVAVQRERIWVKVWDLQWPAERSGMKILSSKWEIPDFEI